MGPANRAGNGCGFDAILACRCGGYRHACLGLGPANRLCGRKNRGAAVFQRLLGLPQIAQGARQGPGHQCAQELPARKLYNAGRRCGRHCRLSDRPGQRLGADRSEGQTAAHDCGQTPARDRACVCHRIGRAGSDPKPVSQAAACQCHGAERHRRPRSHPAAAADSGARCGASGHLQVGWDASPARAAQPPRGA